MRQCGRLRNTNENAVHGEPPQHTRRAECSKPSGAYMQTHAHAHTLVARRRRLLNIHVIYQAPRPFFNISSIPLCVCAHSQWMLTSVHFFCDCHATAELLRERLGETVPVGWVGVFFLCGCVRALYARDTYESDGVSRNALPVRPTLSARVCYMSHDGHCFIWGKHKLLSFKPRERERVIRK